MFVTHFNSIIGDINAHMGFLSEEEVLFLYKVNYQLLNFFFRGKLIFLKLNFSPLKLSCNKDNVQAVLESMWQNWLKCPNQFYREQLVSNMPI